MIIHSSWFWWRKKREILSSFRIWKHFNLLSFQIFLFFCALAKKHRDHQNEEIFATRWKIFANLEIYELLKNLHFFNRPINFLQNSISVLLYVTRFSAADTVFSIPHLWVMKLGPQNPGFFGTNLNHSWHENIGSKSADYTQKVLLKDEKICGWFFSQHRRNSAADAPNCASALTQKLRRHLPSSSPSHK